MAQDRAVKALPPAYSGWKDTEHAGHAMPTWAAVVLLGPNPNPSRGGSVLVFPAQLPLQADGGTMQCQELHIGVGVRVRVGAKVWASGVKTTVRTPVP